MLSFLESIGYGDWILHALLWLPLVGMALVHALVTGFDPIGWVLLGVLLGMLLGLLLGEVLGLELGELLGEALGLELGGHSHFPGLFCLVHNLAWLIMALLDLGRLSQVVKYLLVSPL